jgi:hypothetical protein
LLSHYTITALLQKQDEKAKADYIEIHLEEKNTIPVGFYTGLYESKGFSSITLQDFPIRGKAVYLIIKRRLWRNKANEKEVIKSTFPYVTAGSRITKELLNFLKGTS